MFAIFCNMLELVMASFALKALPELTTWSRSQPFVAAPQLAETQKTCSSHIQRHIWTCPIQVEVRGIVPKPPGIHSEAAFAGKAYCIECTCDKRFTWF